MNLVTLTAICAVAVVSRLVACQTANDDAQKFLSDFNDAAETQYFESVTISWNYFTNLTTENGLKVQNQAKSDANFTLYWGTRAKNQFGNRMNELNESNRRQMEGIQVLGTANLPESEQEDYNRITTSMDSAYSTSCVTLKKGGKCLPLDPDLTELMRSSRDYTELKNVWMGWFETAGQPIKDDYETFVGLSNKAFQADGYSDTGEFWRSWYETDNFQDVMEGLWLELKPMYDELHAYVRRKLYEKYGPKYINLKGPIPAHLLGNMWGQTWGNIYDIVEPFGGKSSDDATPKMTEQGYDALKMFQVSEEFFTSIGLLEMTDKFWNRSMIVKPADGRPVVCQ